MKRVNNIYPKIIDKNNLLNAIYKASNGKKKRKDVKRILDNVYEYVNILYDILNNEKYEPAKYNKTIIFDGCRKKERTIYKLKFFPDQCIHWALMLQIEKILQRGMYYYCCGSIKGKGPFTAKKLIEKILVKDRKYTKYCLQIDIHHFYQNIDKNILKQKFRRIIKDKQTLELIDKIVDSNEDSGIPIGNYTSQHFANYYLQDFDHYVKETLHIKYYVRYMDDALFFSNNKKQLHKTKNLIEEYLKNEKLELKDNWQVFKTDSRPIDFLGYRFYRNYTTLRARNALRIRRRIQKIIKKRYLNKMDAGAVISYYGWIKHTNSQRFYNKYIKKYIKLKKCKEVIRNASRKQYKSKQI